MMRKFTKNIAVLTALGLMLTGINMPNLTVHAESHLSSNAEMLKEKCQKDNTVEKLKEDEELIENRAESKDNYKKVIKKIKKANDTYNSHYAGSYLNKDQELVVLTCGDDKSLKESIENTCGEDEVIFKKAKYSYNELNDAYDEITNYMNKVDFISAVYVDDTNNIVVVRLNEYSLKNIKKTKNEVKNSKLLKFEKSGDIEESAAKTVYPGQKICIGDYLFSMGFRAYYETKNGVVKGFVTAGHNTKVGDKVYYVTSNNNTVPIGTVKYRKFSGKVDASFVALSGDNQASNKVYYNSEKNTNKASGVNLCKDCLLLPEVGDTVYKAGATTYLTKGTIESTKFTANFNDMGITIKNLILTTCVAGKGDSGGILYENDCGNHEIVGVQSGVITQSQIGKNNRYKESIFTSADEITDLKWGNNGIWMY